MKHENYEQDNSEKDNSETNTETKNCSGRINLKKDKCEQGNLNKKRRQF